MTLDWLLVAVLGVLLAAERVGLALERRAWARERAALLLRVQAGTLADYAAHVPTEPMVEQDEELEEGELEEEAPPGLEDGALEGARAALEGLIR